MVELTKEEQERWPNYAKVAPHMGSEDALLLSDFVDYINSRYVLAEWQGDDWLDERLVPASSNGEKLMAEYYGADYEGYRKEREEHSRELLALLREPQLTDHGPSG